MSSTIKKLAAAVVVLGVLALGVFLYLTRPLAAPSETNSDKVSSLEVREGQTLYRVDSASSKVTFTLNEILSGQPTEVVGETNQVTADIAFDPQHPSASQISTVKVNARGLKTDSTRRDAAIGRFILKSEDPAMEYIVFEPKVLESMPEKIENGESFIFTSKGDLTIAGVTKEQVFEGFATLDANNQLKGEATGFVQRADYNLVIPSVPFVANVDQQVKLKIEFVANPVK